MTAFDATGGFEAAYQHWRRYEAMVKPSCISLSMRCRPETSDYGSSEDSSHPSKVGALSFFGCPENIESRLLM